jgi:hypothetical protein
MEFDPFGLSVKDLTTRNVIARSNSTDPLYTLSPRVPLLPAAPRRAPCLPLLRLVFWLLLPHLHGIVALATLALTPYLACLGHSIFPARVLLMIFVMLVSWANTPDCHFPVHRVERKKPLIYYILIFGHLRLLVCLVRNTTWSFLMISLTICGLFRLNKNLAPSPPCPFFLLMLLLISATLSKLYNVTTDVSLTTRPPEPSSCPKVPSCGCRAPTRPHKMVKPSVLFIPLTMSFARC